MNRSYYKNIPSNSIDFDDYAAILSRIKLLYISVGQILFVKSCQSDPRIDKISICYWTISRRNIWSLTILEELVRIARPCDSNRELATISIVRFQQLLLISITPRCMAFVKSQELDHQGWQLHWDCTSSKNSPAGPIILPCFSLVPSRAISNTNDLLRNRSNQYLLAGLAGLCFW